MKETIHIVIQKEEGNHVPLFKKGCHHHFDNGCEELLVVDWNACQAIDGKK